VGVEYANSAGIAEAPISPSGEASKAASNQLGKSSNGQRRINNQRDQRVDLADR